MSTCLQEFSNPTGYLCEFRGDVATEELIGVGDVLRCNEEIVFVVFDFTNALLQGITLNDIHEIAIKDTSLAQTHKIEKLALVGLNGAGRGLAEIYVFFTEKWLGKHKGYETKIFNKPDEAFDWLGIKYLD